MSGSDALDIFLTRMDKSEEKENPIFLLKNLYILDQATE